MEKQLQLQKDLKTISQWMGKDGNWDSDENDFRQVLDKALETGIIEELWEGGGFQAEFNFPDGVLYSYLQSPLHERCSAIAKFL